MTTAPNLAKKDLSHVNLARCDLSGADLHQTTLREAILKETNLEGADLTDADLTHANLGGACLRNASASHANLADADLRDADLEGANLRGARLVGAKLRDADRFIAALAGAEFEDVASAIASTTHDSTQTTWVIDNAEAPPSLEPQAMDRTEGRGGERTGNGEHSNPREKSTLGYVAPMGTEVRGVDGERLGQVAAAWPNYVFVEASPGADAGYWVPVEAFAGTENGALMLSVTRDEAERRGWTKRPPAGPEEPR